MKMNDVLFIIPDNYQDDNQFPLGIVYLSAVLENHGYSVEVYCMDVYHYTNKDLSKKLDDNEYKIIGVGFLAARFKETIIDLCRIINKHKKDAWLILGGHGPSPIPEYMIKTTKCDAVLVGEGENTILEIIKDRIHNDNKKIYIGKKIKYLDDLPLPSWHLFPIEKYKNNFFWKGMDKNDKVMQLISTRGCINKCTFCYRMENGLRLRNIDNILDEMTILNHKYNITTFQFQDELFLVTKKRIDEFKRELEKRDMDIKFVGNARVDILNEEVTRTLKDMGCLLLNVGFESSNQDVLNYMKKNSTVEQNIKALEVMNKINLPSGINFIWGYPPDNKETLFNNAKLIKKYNLYHQLRTIRPVTAYPGCELYYEAIDKGLINGPSDFFNKFINSDLITINYTIYPNELCYKWLLHVNIDLIKDHFLHTTGNESDGNYLINQFKDLYTGRDVKFRGSRHYDNS